jgi:hypothetical protein
MTQAGQSAVLAARRGAVALYFDNVYGRHHLFGGRCPSHRRRKGGLERAGLPESDPFVLGSHGEIIEF